MGFETWISIVDINCDLQVFNSYLLGTYYDIEYMHEYHILSIILCIMLINILYQSLPNIPRTSVSENASPVIKTKSQSQNTTLMLS